MKGNNNMVKGAELDTIQYNIWQEGKERGNFMVEFIKSVANSFDKNIVLDLGCGMGGISIMLAKNMKQVISGDHDLTRLREVRNRILKEKIPNMALAKFDGRALPFKNETFDLIIMNGVLEYLGVNSYGQDPEELQINALKEAKRVLKQDGKLYVAIENRWYPIYLLKDVHSGLAFVTMLPRKIASLYSYVMTRKPYQMYIHSYWGLKKMYKNAGFNRNEFFIPIFNYQYPLAILPIGRKSEILEFIDGMSGVQASSEYKVMSVGMIPHVKVWLLKLVLRIGLIRLLSPCFVTLSSK